jgi:hypothetical protein
MENMEQAMELDICLAPDYPGSRKIIDHLSNGICRTPRIIDNLRSREALRLLISNTCASPKTSQPIKYHLWFWVFEHHSRYPKPHFEHSKVIRIVDSLPAKKFAERLMKFFNRKRNVGCKPLFNQSTLKTVSLGCGTQKIFNDNGGI